MRAAISDRRLLFPRFPRIIEDDRARCRRRTGSEFVAGKLKLVGKGRGRPLDRFRRLQIT